MTLCPIRSALAWGDTGHRIVCEIAFQELTDTARQRVKQLIRLDHEFSRFSDACTWPDHPRKRADEHYVNLPRDAVGIGADECPMADRCVLTAIDRDLAVLSSPTASDQDQLDALKFLGHWVGDVHQPLHVSFEDDRGGNGVGVAGGLCGGKPSRGLGHLHHRAGPWHECHRHRQPAARRDHRSAAVGVAGIHPDRVGQRVVRDRDQPGRRLLRPN